MDKPDVDSIDGLSPAISIDQKTTSKNPRSTVGTLHHKNVISLTSHFLNESRANNQITVFWSDREPGAFCIYDSPTHDLLEAVAGVYQNQPIIYFFRFISHDDTRESNKAFMGITFLHEMAHVLGMPDDYHAASHEDLGMQCVMERYEDVMLEDQEAFYNNALNFYNFCLEYEESPFCSSCTARIKALL